MLDSAIKHGGLLEFAHLEGRFGRKWLWETVTGLVAAGRAAPLGPGVYAVADAYGRISPLALGAYFVPAGYVSLWSAADHYGLTTQDVATIAVVSPDKHLPFDAPALGARFVFHRIAPERMFGWHEEPVGGVFARLADIERLLIDLLWFEGTEGVPWPPQVLAIWQAARGRANPHTLVDYALRMDSTRLTRRVGYLMELYDLGPTDRLTGWREQDRKPIVVFQKGGASMSPSPRWGVTG